MRGDIVFRVYGRHEGREKDYPFGTFRTIAEAEKEVARLLSTERDDRNWAEQYHNLGFVIREIVVETDFEIPSRPKPRDRYFVRSTPKHYSPNTWSGSGVQVFRRAEGGREPEKVCDFERNYSLLGTFEPFRQGDREFALVAPNYTGTSVLDLATGQIIASEADSDFGFCPVGFYVPDWWDLHDGSLIPGSKYWNADSEWPSGEFGFVWGCIWGDDGSWKVQALDLTQIQSGIIRRDDRFGYVELATSGYKSPCFDPAFEIPEKGSAAPPFIRVARWQGTTRVGFSVEMDFDFVSGKSIDWQRLKNENFD